MFCKKCGAQVDDDAMYCSACGEKFTEKKTEEVIAPDKENNEKASDGVAKKIWDKLAGFEKFLFVCVLVGLALVLFALALDKIGAAIIGISQILIFGILWLVYRGIIKPSKKWIPKVALVLAFLLIVPYFSMLKRNTAEKVTSINWSDVVLGEMLPAPSVLDGKITTNNSDSLRLEVEGITAKQYDEYVHECISRGFFIESEHITSSYDAYNSDGYKIALDYYESMKRMTIQLDAPKQYGELIWSESNLAKLVPVPEATKGEISKDDEEKYGVYVSGMPKEKYESYIDECKKVGFDKEINKTDDSFSAKNDERYKVYVLYKGNGVVYIEVTDKEYRVDVQIVCVQNFLFSRYDVDVEINYKDMGTIKHGETGNFTAYLVKGTHTVKFEKNEDDDIEGEIKISVAGDSNFKIQISCESDKIEAKQLELSEESDSSHTEKIEINKNESEFLGRSYTEVEQELRSMGFADFAYEVVKTEDKSKVDGTVSSVKIKDWIFSDGSFTKGDKFDADATVTISYYQYQEPEKPKPVYYSTNDLETAKKGNTGVFAYVSTGKFYDVYYIIDFDEGYVYYFLEGEGNDFCDKLKIDFGDLNNYVQITWHDGDLVWSYGLHFKYVNQPDQLIVQDNDGFEIELRPTDLQKALKIRATKNIKEW